MASPLTFGWFCGSNKFQSNLCKNAVPCIRQYEDLRKTMERRQDDSEDDLPTEGYMTLEQFAAKPILPESESEFLIRAAADAVNRFNEGLGKIGLETPPPIHKYIQRPGESCTRLYFDRSRIGELGAQIYEDMKRPDDTL